MLTQEFAKQSLVRARLVRVGERMRHSREPIAQRGARSRWKRACASREVTAPCAESTSRRMTEDRRRIRINGRMTFGAVVDGRRETELGDDAPRVRDGHVAR